MSAASGLKRLGFVLLAASAAVTGLLIGASYLISAESVRHQALREIRAATGLEPVLRGPATVALFPNGSVSFDDVVLGDSQRPALTAERLTARLRFFPLLMGRVEIADVSLHRPTIAIDIAGNRTTNWSGLIEALAREQNPGVTRTTGFSEMRIEGGVVVVRDLDRNSEEKLTGVDFSLAWPSISRSFGATGRFVWHDEPMDASVTLTDFAAALKGNKTGIKIRVAGRPIKSAFEGSISVSPTLKIEGTVAADAPSLRNALIWAGQRPLPGGGFGRFTIKAQTNVVGGTIGLSNVNVELDGNAAEGVLTFATDGRQTLQGTLAAEKLDLSPYISTARLLTANQREWNNTRIALDGLNGVDLDLRLSAARVTASNATLGRTAIATNLRNGHLVITIGEAQAYGGVMKGSLALATSGQNFDVKSQLQFIGVELENCLGQLFGLRKLEGKGDIAIALEGSGESVLAVTRTLQGNASLVGQNGALTGLDVEQLLRRLERRPLSGAGDFRRGRTPFNTITAALKIERGTAAVDRIKIEGAAVRLALAGSASIPDRELDLKGTAGLVAAARANVAPFELPFIVQGSWDDPIMLPDPEALIRRSGAAAPLLNAVRERSTSDQVRSVIERLTGGAIPAVEQQTAPAAKSE